MSFNLRRTIHVEKHNPRSNELLGRPQESMSICRDFDICYAAVIDNGIEKIAQSRWIVIAHQEEHLSARKLRVLSAGYGDQFWLVCQTKNAPPFVKLHHTRRAPSCIALFRN
jgi:hypothetical protein